MDSRILMSHSATQHLFAIHPDHTLKTPLKSARKVKAISLQAWTVPEGSRRLRITDFKTIGTKSHTHRPPLPTRKYSWYPFLLEAESTSGPQCGRKDYVNEEFQ